MQALVKFFKDIEKINRYSKPMKIVRVKKSSGYYYYYNVQALFRLIRSMLLLQKS